MNFEIEQKVIIEHLSNVIKGISNKNLIPILNCIKMDLTEKGLYLLSTNNDIAIKSFIPKEKIKKVNNYGTIVVYGKYLYEIIRKLPDTAITIEEVLEDKINIYTNKSSFFLNCNKVEDFPILDLQENTDPVKINKKVLKNIINQTIFATSMEESRPILTGLNIYIKDNVLKCTATDSYRLSTKEIQIENKVSNEINIIIPSKNIQELNKIITEDDETEIELHIFNNNVIFRFNNIEFMSRLINGSYPDTSALIPNDYKIKLNINRQELFNSIDRASLLTNEHDKHIITLDLKNNLIKILSNIPEIGKVEEQILLTEENNMNMTISFSSKYMLEALRSMNEPTINLYLNGELKPIILKNGTDETLTQLILPIRTY